MLDVIFKEYDIRGVVGRELLVDQVYDLTRAILFYMHEEKPDLKTIAVGMDGRLHSQAIKDEMCRAIQDSGMDVLFVGMCPSPVLYFALHTQPVDAGLMITASHNAKEYNGIKICLGKESVWGTQIQEIKELYKQKKQIVSAARGAYEERLIIPVYVDWLAKHFSHLVDMPLAAVVDCANAAGGTVLPALVGRMQWPNVTVLFAEVDGNYPNHEADPTVEENMEDVKRILMKENGSFPQDFGTGIQDELPLKTSLFAKASPDASGRTDWKPVLGIGLDGDCDRMAAMTRAGFLVPGDQLLALFAQQVVKDNPGAAVVFDIKSSSGLAEVLEQLHAKPILSATGHSNIKQAMKKSNALLGGELSCHFFFHDRYFGYDDGIYAMMRLFEILSQSDKTLEQLLMVFPKKFSSREYRIACREEDKKAIIQTVHDFFAKRSDAELVTIDGVRATMPEGWGIVRSSNTQPVISMRFESDSSNGLQVVKQLFIDALTPYYTDSQLQELLKP